MQARLSPAGFDFLERDLMALVEAALKKPLAIKIPKTPLKNAAGAILLTLCDKDGGCDASLRVIEDSLQIQRMAPSVASERSLMRIDARVEIEANGLLFVPGDPGFEERDCQVDLRYIDHHADVCRAANLSWAKAANPYNPSDSGWSETAAQANAFCAPGSAGEGRGIGAAITFGVDEALGYPQVSVDDISVSFATSQRVPAMNDLRIYHPNRPYTCADGTQNPACAVFERSILKDAPLTCLGLQFVYDSAMALLQETLNASAKIVINQQLKALLSVSCTRDEECQLGATCNTIEVSPGFPEGCSGSECLLAPALGKVCNVNGKVVPPLAGLETELNLGTLNPSYTPDNVGPIKVIAAVGGYVGNDPMPEVADATAQTERGLTIGGFFGAETAQASCVPVQAAPAVMAIAPMRLPETVEVWDPAQKTMAARGYHAAVSIHRSALARTAHAAYTNGAICLGFTGSNDLPLNSQVLALMVPEIGTLEQNALRPSFMYIYPETVPQFAIGEGRMHETADGTKAIDSPHVQLRADRLHMDLYSQVQGRYVRLFTMVADLDVGLFVEITQKNELLPLSNDLHTGVKNLRVSNIEMISQDATMLERSVPAFVDLSVPIITEIMMKAFPLPDSQVVPGYHFEIVGLRGMQAIAGSDPLRYEYLSVFGMLQKGMSARREATLDAPRAVATAAAVGPAQARLAFSSDAAGDVEYAYRLNGGVYSLFEARETLVIDRPQLRARGPHKLEVLARRISDRSLLAAPVATSFVMSEDEAAASFHEQRDAQGCHAGGDVVWGVIGALLLWLCRRKESNQ